MKNGDWMDVDLVFDTDATVEEFMAIVSTQRKQKKSHAKITAREKKKKKSNHFFTTVSAIIVQEEEYLNGDVLNIDKKEEDRKINKSLMNNLRPRDIYEMVGDGNWAPRASQKSESHLYIYLRQTCHN